MIRYAQLNDTPGILPLLSDLGYDCELKDLKVRFLRFLDNKGYGVAVYEIDTIIIGVIAWSKSDLFVSDKARFHIEALVVLKNHRGLGIGKKLILFLEELAQEHSPAIVDLTSGIRRAKDGSHEFYKSLGYQNEGPMAKLYLRKEV